MSESDVLLTFAEVAVAFAGFASLVGVLGQRKSADDPRVIGLRMRGMLLTSLMVIAFSIFPILLTRYGASPDLTWKASSLALFAATACYYVWFWTALRGLGRSDIPTTGFQMRVIVPTLFSTMIGLAALLLGNLTPCHTGGLPDGAGAVAFSVRIRFLSYRFFVLASGRIDRERQSAGLKGKVTA